MAYNPNIHHRRSIRLKGYDYSQAGLYFMTICCQNKACLFGEIINGEMILNDAGKMIDKEWLKLTDRFKNIQLHEHIVMPNHFHGIIQITNDNVGAPLVGAQNNMGIENINDTENNIDVPNNNGNNVRSQKNVHPQNDIQPQKGQPQGIAPTGLEKHADAQKMDLQNDVDGQNNVGAPLVGAQNNMDSQNNMGTEINTDATNDNSQNDIQPQKGQPQGIAPTGSEKHTDATKKTIGDMMDAFKSITTVEYIRGVENFGWQRFNGKMWQRNYHEHIIRNEQSYQTIAEYIINNPAKWNEDKFYTK